MKLFYKRFACALLSLTLASCSGLPIQEATTVLRAKQSCCKSYKDLSTRNLALGERLKFDLDAASPVMDFPEGRSFVEAFVLPTGTTTLAVQSVYPEYLPKGSYIDPILIFLDESKNELARYARLDLRNDKHIISGGLLMEWHFGATVPVPPKATYVMVYANNSSTRILRTVSDAGTVWPAPPAPIGTLALIQ